VEGVGGGQTSRLTEEKKGCRPVMMGKSYLVQKLLPSLLETDAQHESETQRMRRMAREQRDRWLLWWIGEQGAIRLDQVPRLVALAPGATGPSAVTGGAIRYLVRRWQRLGWVQVEKRGVADPAWLSLTANGLMACDRAWAHPAKVALCGKPLLDSLYATNDVRLTLEQEGWSWRPTRTLLTRSRGEAVELPDGMLCRQGECVSLDVCVGSRRWQAWHLLFVKRIRQNELPLSADVLGERRWTSVWVYTSAASLPALALVRAQLVLQGVLTRDEGARIELHVYPPVHADESALVCTFHEDADQENV